MGLINQKSAAPAEAPDPAPDAAPDNGTQPMQDSVLKAAEAKVESQLTPQNRDDYDRIVTAGMQTALEGGPNSMMAKLKGSKDPLGDCAKGAIGLGVLMYKHSRGTMPIKAMVPACMTLMLQALDFADKAGIVKVGTPELVQATHVFANVICNQFGLTPQMLTTAAGKIKDIANDPSAMMKVHMAAGVLKDPRAPSPTPMPEDAAPPAQGDANGAD